LPHYNKTASLTQQAKLIPRFLSQEVSLVLLKEILIIRPFAQMLAIQVGHPCNYQDHLFISGGAVLSAEKMYDMFAREFFDLSDGVEINIKLCLLQL
ncbi:MAG: hypothetical protein ACEQSR_13405, partial [Candidatus Methylacidiphilales bacterium]